MFYLARSPRKLKSFLGQLSFENQIADAYEITGFNKNQSVKFNSNWKTVKFEYLFSTILYAKNAKE